LGMASFSLLMLTPTWAGFLLRELMRS